MRYKVPYETEKDKELFNDLQHMILGCKSWIIGNYENGSYTDLKDAEIRLKDLRTKAGKLNSKFRLKRDIN